MNSDWSSLAVGYDADLVPLLVLVLELHDAVDEREDRVIRAQPDVRAGVPLRPVLADDDVAGPHDLASVLLDPEKLRVGITAVPRGTYTFLVSHLCLPSAEADALDSDFGELLAMSLLARVVLPALELEHDDLVTESVLDDFAGDLGSGERGGSSLDGIALTAEQYVIENDRRARLTLD